MSDEQKIKLPRLSAQAILDAADLEPVEVEVPEWGSIVVLRPLSAREAMQFATTEKGKPDDPESMARLLVMSAINEDGSPLFTADDVKAINKKSMRAMMRLQNAALELNGLKEEAKKAAKKD